MIWLWITIAVLLLTAGALVPVLGNRRAQRLRSNDEAIAARARHSMLAHYLDTTRDADNELFAQARERWNTAGALLANAATEAEFRHAEDAAKQGLALVAMARKQAGLPWLPRSAYR